MIWTIDSSVSARGNALRLDVTALAPEGGSWCPVMLNVKYGTNKLIDATGATDFIFWVNTTKYKGYQRSAYPEGNQSVYSGNGYRQGRQSDR